MMKKQFLPVIIGAVLFSTLSCSSNKTTGAFYTYQTECLGVELDGSQTLWVWGTGKNKTDAIEQAKKNAVHEVIFKGISAGDPSCNRKALLLEVNANEKYEDYFNAFFVDKGLYNQFVTTEDRRWRSDVKQSSDRFEKWGTTVRVLRSQLREKLIYDNILK